MVMKIKSISFENYKAFAERQTVKLKPITLLIGKNSSGKSSIAKLFTLFENSLSGSIDEPLLLKNDGVDLGAEFRDLVFGRNSTPLTFNIEFEDNKKLETVIIQENLKYELDIFEWKLNNFKITYYGKDYYLDEEGNEYNCNFKGFIPTQIRDLLGNDKVNDFNLADFKIDVDYIGPFRFLPQRQFNLTGQVKFKKTGIKGENAYAMLGVSKTTETDLHEKVGKWYEKHFDGWRLVVDSSTSSEGSQSFQVLLQKTQTRLETSQLKHQDEIKVNIVDVGQGMNQALPLVVRAYSQTKDSIIVLEQPELHLHPAAHGDLAELFAKSAKEKDQTFVIETHSENILLRLRKLVIENNFGFTKDDLIIYWIEEDENEGQRLLEIEVDEEGVLSDWRDGVFNENVKEILAMQKALKEKSKQKL
jgi:predicted ATPase